MSSSVTSPSAVIRPGLNWMYASTLFISGELQKHSTPRRLLCATAVPIEPGDVPITPDGFRANEFLPQGRLAQSIAFFRPPGIERLYSGRDEQHGVAVGDRFLERARHRRIVGVVILAVERQVAERDLLHLQLGWCQADERLGQLSIDRSFCKTADKIADVEFRHEILLNIQPEILTALDDVMPAGRLREGSTFYLTNPQDPSRWPNAIHSAPTTKGPHNEQEDRFRRSRNQGTPRAVNLSKADFEVVGYDAFAGSRAKATAAGVEVRSSLIEVAEQADEAKVPMVRDYGQLASRETCASSEDQPADLNGGKPLPKASCLAKGPALD